MTLSVMQKFVKKEMLDENKSIHKFKKIDLETHKFGKRNIKIGNATSSLHGNLKVS